MHPKEKLWCLPQSGSVKVSIIVCEEFLIGLDWLTDIFNNS